MSLVEAERAEWRDFDCQPRGHGPDVLAHPTTHETDTWHPPLDASGQHAPFPCSLFPSPIKRGCSDLPPEVAGLSRDTTSPPPGRLPWTHAGFCPPSRLLLEGSVLQREWGRIPKPGKDSPPWPPSPPPSPGLFCMLSNGRPDCCHHSAQETGDKCETQSLR